MRPHSTEPMPTNFEEAIGAVERWTQSTVEVISRADAAAAAEILRRVLRLRSTFTRLAEINARLMAVTPLTTSFDAATDTFIARSGDGEIRVKLKRADPSVPIGFTQLTEGGAYVARPKDAVSAQDSDELKAEMEDLLENYYYNAHRVLKLVQRLPRMRNFKCKEVVVVRNKLIEHADHGDMYSFGYGSTGPRVKPMGRPGREWNDEGLFTNTESFLGAPTAHFSQRSARDA